MKNKKCKIFLNCSVVFLIIIITRVGVFAQEFPDLEGFSGSDKVLVLAPHPDDESIGCAGVIQRAVKANAQVKVMYLTNGDHNELAFIVYEKRPVFFNREFVAMGRIREDEGKTAMRLLGLKDEDLIFLGYPDYGTNKIFFSFWETSRPFASYLTRQSYVPYKESPSFRAPYKAENILADIKKVLVDYKPNKIFVSHPADLNGDHWAYYLFLQIALRDLRGTIEDPKLFVYFIHAPGWPMPRNYHPDIKLAPSEKHFPDELINWHSLKLSKDEIEKKYKAILCYRSQTCVSAFYLLAFARQNELFGDYPLIELKKQKTDGRLTDYDYFKSSDRVSFAVVDQALWIRMKKPQELRRRLFFSVHLFGYSDTTAFSKMPNIWIKTKYNNLRIYDTNSGKELDLLESKAILEKEYLIVKIPLKILGDPNYILGCVATDKPFLPVESVGFRRMEIQD